MRERMRTSALNMAILSRGKKKVKEDSGIEGLRIVFRTLLTSPIPEDGEHRFLPDKCQIPEVRTTAEGT
jgi:hypothetical protein